nr:uncharacterized protein CI109_003767 [Kwoniella shandongensis]KAA5527796.1 hypothetical protein CI109_003767 [Kwoniella shandongensis]
MSLRASSSSSSHGPAFQGPCLTDGRNSGTTRAMYGQDIAFGDRDREARSDREKEEDDERYSGRKKIRWTESEDKSKLNFRKSEGDQRKLALNIDIEAISADPPLHRNCDEIARLSPSDENEKDVFHCSTSEVPTSPITPRPRPRSRVRQLSTLVQTSWTDRHDPSHDGFWHSTRRCLIGTPSPSSPNTNEQDSVDRSSDPDYVPPKYRWTLILSGLLQPFSILLEIPGLTEHWYVRTINNVPVVYQSNPILLDVGLAISMVCGIIANIALISRFLERRVYVSTIITIVGLTIHDIINIIAVTIFGVVHAVDDGFTYSEAFWLCVCSTAASMFTNATLIYDLIRTSDFKKSGSGLTPKQRNLVIITMIILVYLALGALCFNFLVPEISFQNALYYTVVTIETIGFGDVTPSTLGARIFLMFYAPVGIMTLAVTVGTARDTIVESWNTAYRRRRYEMLKKDRIRKRQRREESAKRIAIEKRLEEIGKPVWIDTRGGGVRGGAKGKRLNVGALTKEELEQAEMEAMDDLAISRGESRPVDETGTMLAGAQRKKGLSDELNPVQEELNKQSLDSEEGYREFQERLAKEEKMENLIKFAFAMTLFLLFWIIGATVFCKTEDWSWFVAFYFCFVTFTTIGYGEVAPQTPAGRAFFIIWAIFGVATVTLFIAVLIDTYSRLYRKVVVQTPTQPGGGGDGGDAPERGIGRSDLESEGREERMRILSSED